MSPFRYEETRIYSDAVKYICSLLFGRATLSSFLKKHFGRLPEKYPIVSAEFPRFRHPCLALALSRYMKLPGGKFLTALETDRLEKK
jgi:hypothetical protein